MSAGSAFSRAEGPSLCVAIATRNRRDSLYGALESVAPQLREDDELLLIESGPTRGRARTPRDWLAERAPRARVLDEPRGGISRARNVALREATAPIVCFLDDDEQADPGWLDALRCSWVRAGPRVAAVGGPMHIVWPASRPAWLPDYLIYVVNSPDLGAERHTLDQTPGRGYLSGGNMSVRVDAAVGAGGFDPELGVRPEAPFDRGEEDDLQRRLAATGWEIWYEPAATVRHFVEEERLTTSYFRELFHQSALRDVAKGSRRLQALERLARSSARYAVLRARRHPEAVTATFTWLHAWTVLTAPRSGRKANGC